MTVRIEAPTHRRVGQQHEVAATVAGERLWFRHSEQQVGPLRGEPFVAAALVPAMLAGGPLLVDPTLPVCPSFLAGARQFMDVFRFWGPGLGLALRPVEIIASEAAAPPPVGDRDVALFFSGGVDGMWSLREYQHPATMAVFVHGIDFQLDNPMAHEAARRNREWLARRGVPLVEVETNIRFVGTRLGVRWNKHNGACLAAVAHVVGAATTVIASGFSWHFTGPNGTHVATDPLLSSATRRIVHHGFGRARWQKLERLAGEPGALDLLRVCWQDREYNCGRCRKCHRTMLLLELLELESGAFPRAPAGSLVPNRIDDPEARHYVVQALDLARLRHHREIESALERLLQRDRRRRVARQTDEAFLGGTLGRLRRAVRRAMQRSR